MRICLTLAGIFFLMTTSSAKTCLADGPADAFGTQAKDTNKNPPELGKVAWLRGFESAAAMAKADDKPLLVLFQEVPGCSTCVNYGGQVLSHPLIVEAAETLFTPVCIYNNIKGDDERTLKHFSEPTWNNPVVRIMTADKKPLTDRVAEDYTVAGLASAMCKAVKKSGGRVPAYLRLLADETGARKGRIEKATFAMHCFWEGEGALGRLDGVVGTMPGFVDGLEVVEVEFDPGRLPYDKLLSEAKSMKCASKVFARSDAQLRAAKRTVGDAAVRSDEKVRPDKEPKYYLLQTPLRHVPMTPLQAARVNAALGKHESADPFLSPRQLALLAEIKSRPKADWPVVIGKEITAAWEDSSRLASSPGGK